MSISQARPKLKVSGGRYKRYRKDKQYELARNPTLTKIGKQKSKSFKILGGHKKYILISAEIANIYNPKTKKYQKTKIKTVLENPANRHYVRRNVLTKGTIIDTELGKAKITSRPGQEGTINAILV